MTADNLKELIAWGDEGQPEQGVSLDGRRRFRRHVAGVFFNTRTGTEFQFVPYRGHLRFAR